MGSEGGYDTNRKDRGNWTSGKIGEGELKGTKYGIAAHVYPHLDIKNLTLDQAKDIYLHDYWGLRCDDLKPGLDYIYFDMCVNNGKGAATKLLQRGLGVASDGIWGPKTQAALNAADPDDLIESISDARVHYYQSLETFPVFGRGWLNRVARVKDDALAMT